MIEKKGVYIVQSDIADIVSVPTGGWEPIASCLFKALIKASFTAGRADALKRVCSEISGKRPSDLYSLAGHFEGERRIASIDLKICTDAADAALRSAQLWLSSKRDEGAEN